MNQQRFQELARKRDGTGLSGEEADELGRMIAEREGRPYGPEPPQQEQEEEEEEDRGAGMEERAGRRSS